MDQAAGQRQSRVLLAGVPAGALLALGAELLPGAWALGWLAAALPVLALSAPTRGAGARLSTWAALGWGAGLLYWSGQLEWLYPALVRQAGMGTLHFVNAAGLLVTLLALLWAGMFALARHAWVAWRLSPVATLPVLLAALDALLGAYPFAGFAWGSLAGPQAHTVAARAVVPLLGGAGLVLLLGLVGAGWGAWLRAWFFAGSTRRLALGGAAWALVTALCAWPAPASEVPADARALRALLVPGDVSLATLTAQRDTPAPLRSYLGRTLAAPEAASAQPGAARTGTAQPEARPLLVVWPESAVPGQVARGKALVELSALGAVLGADLLLGSNGEAQGREYNSLFLVQGGPFDFWRYDKRALVPFGEYVPAGFRWLFPRKATAGEADYAAGMAPPVLDWRGVHLGVAICFEAILPRHVRAEVRAGADVLVTVANDAWLTPAARRQHLRLAALRGLEAGRDVLRVANRGWSGLLRGGQAVERLHWTAPPRTVMARLRAGQTPYVRWGALPLAILSALLLAGAALLARRQRRGGGPSAQGI